MMDAEIEMEGKYRGMRVTTAQQDIERILRRLPEMMQTDRIKVRRQVKNIRQSLKKERGDRSRKAEIDRLATLAEAAVKRRRRRLARVPSLTYPGELPITAKKAEVIRLIKTYQVVIVSGETGSGKTTQIPKFCLEAGRGIDGKIGCTQPRRIAATTVSHRIAEELGEPLGASVGYKIRFADKGSRNAYIKIMTDGILLAETQKDPFLKEYDTIIVDEAHERSLNIDFILGILKSLLAKRKNLKLIITSATIDTEKFSNAFDRAPVVEVSGRMYPVETRYTDFPPSAEAGDDPPHVEMAVAALDRIQKQSPFGDVLIFMPTEQDIRETCDLIAGRQYKNTIVLPLFARLSADQQRRVFQRSTGRKVIVATNVAETSITIPGIKYVIDTGLARISRYSPRTRTNALPVLPISRSSADQRQGRCGRVENGVCIRLYPETDYESRPLFTAPEILRSNLAEVILRMIALGLGQINDFPFIDRPMDKSIKDGFQLLLELGAIAEGGTGGPPVKKRRAGGSPYILTRNGRLMASIPIDPRLSRMLIEARQQGCLEAVMIIVSALSIQDPRERPAEKEAEADQAHHRFADDKSDFMALLNIWNAYQKERSRHKGLNTLRIFCRRHFLSFKRMREWMDIHTQIREMLDEYGFGEPRPVSPPSTDITASDERYKAIHTAILSGYLSNIAMKKEKYFFKAAKDKEVMIFPGSGVFKQPGEWIVAAEMVETSRLFARTVAVIDSKWIEPLAGAQCKYTYLNPHWERNRSEVTATEQVSLYGLIIEAGRPVSYGKIDPETARNIFIQSALIDLDVRKPLPFMEHNQRLMDEIRSMEDRVRRRDLLVYEEDIVRFYRERLPGVNDLRTLMKTIKSKGGDGFLRFKKSDLLRSRPDRDALGLFPERIALGEQHFDCTYRFDPGKEADGVTVRIPASSAPNVDAEAMDWLVPGLFREKITALIKGLPKAYRKQLVPIARTVDIIADELPRENVPLPTLLSRFLHSRMGVSIPASAWSEDTLPDHLRMRIAIIDPHGEVLRTDRNKGILYSKETAGGDSAALEAAQKQWERSGIVDWDFGDLPESITLKRNTPHQWTVYPALATEDQGVCIRLFSRSDKALASHKAGVAALLSRYFSKDLKFLSKSMVLPGNVQKGAAYFGGAKAFEKRLRQGIIRTLFERNIRKQSEYLFYRDTLSHQVMHRKCKERLDAVCPLLDAYAQIRTTLHTLEQANAGNDRVLNLLERLRSEIFRMVPENFPEIYDEQQFGDLVRYIKAMGIRAQRGAVNPEKDMARERIVAPFSVRLEQLITSLTHETSSEKRRAIESFYWMLEEYKISVFAQEIKTAMPVSESRLKRKLEEIERMI